MSIAILSAVRTPIGRFLGSLKDVPAKDLGIGSAKAALERAGVAPLEVGETIFGMARQAGNGPNPARQVSLGAGVPEETPAWTVNQACASGVKAITLGAAAIEDGEAEIALVGGMESMTRVPYLLENARLGYRLGPSEVVDGMYRDGFDDPLSKLVMGETAEELAGEKGITRAAADAWALGSQNRNERARAAGRFASEIAPITVPGRRGDTLVETDEHPRDGVTLPSLEKLAPVFRPNGTVTAGNASGITDGAAMLLMMTRAKAEALGLPILASFVDHSSAGVAPARMGYGPVPAIEKLLAKRGLSSVNAFDLVEINEAFAAQVLACERALGLERERLNVNGGSIALGHPIGATGARIVVTLLHELRRRGQASGLASLCVSGGFGIAAAFRNEDAA
ncbi:MAG: thiolase family protein [Gemmatimonadetes bacterium]|nr:thiolase family protein [Gemmatimonadota bacterium]